MPKRVFFTLAVLCGALFIFTRARVVTDGDLDFVADTIDTIAKRRPEAAGDRRIARRLDEDRGHLYNDKKILNHIYPILAALLFAKVIVVPLVLKMLVAATASAFVMSKIALLTSVFLALSWLLGATRERAKLQIVQYPVNTPKKVYGGWHVKHVPDHATAYSDDWGYDDDESHTNDKSFFL